QLRTAGDQRLLRLAGPQHAHDLLLVGPRRRPGCGRAPDRLQPRARRRLRDRSAELTMSPLTQDTAPPGDAPETPLEAIRRRSHALFLEFQDAPPDSPAALQARDDLVRLHLPLVDHCA